MYILYCVGEPVKTYRSGKEAYTAAMKYVTYYFGLVADEVESLNKSYEHNPNDFGVMGYVWVQKLKSGDYFE